VQVKHEKDSSRTAVADGKGDPRRSLPATLQPKSQNPAQDAVECIDIDSEPPKKKLMAHSSTSSSEKFKQFQANSGWKPRRSGSASAR
jgi:hypothetical protein